MSKRRESRNLFLDEILPWYEKHGRKLPWRRERVSAYRVWVSEVMLQQTQVPRVILYYERFLRKFPNVKTLAAAAWGEFLPYYEGLGYYARGRNMLKAAKIVAEEYRGKFPREKKSLMALPGIGEYTASAILSFAYGLPEVAFDTNLKKIFGMRENAERAFREAQRRGVSSKTFNSAAMDWASEFLKSRISRGTKRQIKPLQKYPRGETVVTLHENHKIYFSLTKKKYTPFVLPKGVRSRANIKRYFFEKYGLKVSVRPPQKEEQKKKQEKNLGGKTFASVSLHINVQILSGTHNFFAFSREEIYNGTHER